MTAPKFLPTLALVELPPGSMQGLVIADREIVLCRSREGQVYALDNICTHAMARMDEGRLRGNRLICPLHGASFDVRDGRVLGAPAVKPLACHTVRICGEQIEVAINAVTTDIQQPF